MSAPVRYTVTPLNPEAHLFQVQCHIPEPDPAGQVLRLPAWIRGSYLVRDFAKHIEGFSAHCDGQPVAWERIDKASLRCEPASGALQLQFRVYAYDNSVRKAYLDDRRGFFNGTSMFYRVLAADEAGYELELRPPPGSAYRHWHTVCTLAPQQIDRLGFGLYRAADFDELIDHPVEMGAFQRADFDVDGIPHAFVLSGRFEADLPRLCEDVRRICEVEREMFGGEPAQSQYLFLTNVVGNGYGGLEHKDSCALICSRDDLPKPGETAISKRYRGFLGLCSHEYFHLWNVKRIRPSSFAESDLAAEAYTRDLWHYEGVTSYYDDLFLRRAGLIDAQTYLDIVAANATRVEATPGRALHSLAESSFEAWTKFYQPDEHTPNATVSYYVKGALAALCVDLHLRRHTEHTLDDAMRLLWSRYGAQDQPVPEGGLEAVLYELCPQPALPLDAWLRGTGELPIDTLLAEFGVRAEKRLSHGAADAGGISSGSPVKSVTGIRLRPDGEIVAGVQSASAAQNAGISGGDQIVAIDGLRAQGRLPALIAELQPGRTVEVHLFRGDELRVCCLTPAAPQPDTWELRMIEADADALARRVDWLGA